MTAFATREELSLLTGRVFTTEQEPQIGALLEAASSYLRGIIGQQVYPVTQVEYVAYPSECRVVLPQHPLVSVDSVERDGAGISYSYRPPFVLVDGDDPVTVTFTYGYEVSPPELVRLTCVLVSQALVLLEANLGLSSGGLSSVAIDDFKIAFADGGAQSGMAITEHAEASLRRQFGVDGVDVVGVW